MTEQDILIKAYKSAIKDKRSAEFTKNSKRRRKKRKVKRRRTSMKRNTRPQDSICWDCKNARAHLCAWIGRGEKIWDEADKQERVNNIKYYKGKKPTYTVYIVKRCKYFDPEEGKRRIAATM